MKLQNLYNVKVIKDNKIQEVYSKSKLVSILGLDPSRVFELPLIITEKVAEKLCLIVAIHMLRYDKWESSSLPLQP